MSEELKLLFAGAMGAGKTTAIRAISEIAPITTEAANSDHTECNKEETTVAMDYGEITLATGEKLRLYGTPGQARFQFMWPILATGALGVVILIDNSRPDPLADLELYLDAFRALADGGAAVVGVGRMDRCPQPSLEAYAERLAALDVVVPIVPADVRRRNEVLTMLEILLQQLEATWAYDEAIGDGLSGHGLMGAHP
nr:ATP/GTP-binding protein [Acidiferrobacter sp.]